MQINSIMGIPNVEINYIAVLIASIVSFVVGMLWYSPFIFGKIWMRELKMSGKKFKKKDMILSSVANFFATLILVCVYSRFIIYLTVENVLDVLSMSFMVWIGFFVCTTLIGGVLWERKSLKSFAIGAGYWLVNLIVIGLVLIAF